LNNSILTAMHQRASDLAFAVSLILCAVLVTFWPESAWPWMSNLIVGILSGVGGMFFQRGATGREEVRRLQLAERHVNMTSMNPNHECTSSSISLE
jgi:hypothetical protein